MTDSNIEPNASPPPGRGEARNQFEILDEELKGLAPGEASVIDTPDIIKEQTDSERDPKIWNAAQGNERLYQKLVELQTLKDLIAKDPDNEKLIKDLTVVQDAVHELKVLLFMIPE